MELLKWLQLHVSDGVIFLSCLWIVLILDKFLYGFTEMLRFKMGSGLEGNK